MQKTRQQVTVELLRDGRYEEVLKVHKLMVTSIVNRFAAYAYTLGVEKEDLTQWALIEMYQSCKSYNAGKGMSFGSHAYRNVQRTLINKLGIDSNHSVGDISIDNVSQSSIYPNQENEVERDQQVSQLLTYAFDSIENDAQWAAFVGFMEDESMSDVAKEIGCSQQYLSFTLKTLFDKIRKKAGVE